jgi:hypothetical protein
MMKMSYLLQEGVTNIKLFEKIHEEDGGSRSHKRSSEVFVTDPPRPSTFLEGDFNMVMDDQCQFHRDAKHTMRECK